MDLKKGHVEESVKDETLTEEVISVLKMRLEISKASIKKYKSIADAVDADGRLRNTLQFAAAGRTWRWGGRKFQPQNLPRPHPSLEKVQDRLAADVANLDPAMFEQFYPEPMEALSTAVRPSVEAPEGYVFVDADLNAIENRVAGWLCDEDRITQVFRDKRDPYVDFGKYMTGRPYDELFKEYKAGNKKVRTLSKPPVLGCFGPETLVLTDNGWKPLLLVEKTDRVFDGDSFVSHGGVVCQGEKEVMGFRGVHVTPDHQIMTRSGWRTAACIVENTYPELVSGNGPLLCLSLNITARPSVIVEQPPPSAYRISKAVALLSAITANGETQEVHFGRDSETISMKVLLTDIGILQGDATILDMLTTPTTEAEGLSAFLNRLTRLLNTAIAPGSLETPRWTEETTTATIRTTLSKNDWNT